MRFPFSHCRPPDNDLDCRFCPTMADVRLMIEIKPFKPVGQDDQSGVDNQGFCIDRSCEQVQQAPAIDRPRPTKG